MSDSLRPHGPQQARPPCPSLMPIDCQRLPKPMSIEFVMPSNHFIVYHPLHLPPSVFPSIRFFSNKSALCIKWPKYWGFSFSISPSNEYSRLISFRMDWLDLLAVQGTLKSLLQHHSSKASILQCSAFFIIQLSHPYMRNANQSYNEVPIYTYQNGHHQKNLQTINAGEGVEKRESSCIVDWNVNWYSHLENSMEIP